MYMRLFSTYMGHACCSVWQCVALYCRSHKQVHFQVYLHTSPVTHCNTLQHTATHCHTATHSNTLQYTATRCNTGLFIYMTCNLCSFVFHVRWSLFMFVGLFSCSLVSFHEHRFLFMYMCACMVCASQHGNDTNSHNRTRQHIYAFFFLMSLFKCLS